MKLQGLLDFSLGNFLCLRGYAPMGILHDISQPDASFQRRLIDEHKSEMVAFLDEGEFLFFPEVILCATLGEDESNATKADALREAVRKGENFKDTAFDDFKLKSSVNKSQSNQDSRGFDFLTRATLNVTAQQPKFSRIDGNHRLSATPESNKFRDYNAPFCLILFRNPSEAKRFSRALFHNINYKQEPLTMEQNLRLILDDESLFSDDDLKNKPSFGWPYYLARKAKGELDPDYLSHLEKFIEQEPLTFLVEQFRFLIERKILKANESAKREFKTAFVGINQLFASQTLLQESKNRGLLAALLYYQLKNAAVLPNFVNWVLKNHLHLIENSTPSDLIQIFDKILESRKKNIFISMAFGKPKCEGHLKVIERVCADLNNEYSINPPLTVQVVNASTRGDSFDINAEIIEMINGCGLLIGNLTYARPNVYHEIGFVMGKANAMGVAPEILLFVDQTVDDTDCKVHFNLSGLQYIGFGEGQQDSVFAEDLRKRLKAIFNLAS